MQPTDKSSTPSETPIPVQSLGPPSYDPETAEADAKAAAEMAERERERAAAAAAPPKTSAGGTELPPGRKPKPIAAARLAPMIGRHPPEGAGAPGVVSGSYCPGAGTSGAADL